MALFQRLIGLETEYALRLPREQRASADGIHSHRDGYEALARTLRTQLPCAEADAAQAAKEGLFLGTGGAVWFESLRPMNGTGLIEGATPECHGPRELLACQRAQDRMLDEAARQHGLALVKNCRDHLGNAYGAQENYEVVFAEGTSLRIWKIAVLACFLPLVFLFQMGAAIVLVASLLTLPVTALIHLALRRFLTPQQRERSFDFWIGRCFRKGWNGVEPPCGGWISRPLLWFVIVAVSPLAAAVWLLVQFTRLGRMQRDLTAFLVSRSVFAGAGGLNVKGRFQLSEKADAIQCVNGLPEFARPIFSLGQFLKPCVVLVRIRELFNDRQRLQISLGDSNLCEEAEYLRVGTTLLVIEALEAGAMTDLPRLARPLKALRAINADPTLRTEVQLRDGRMVTALQLQWWYLNACRAFVDELVESTDEPLDEACDILRRWEDVLDELERGTAVAADRHPLIGRVDWITKRFLLDSAGHDLPVAARKKIDVRYHELSNDGYFRLLEQAGLHHRVLCEEDVARATRLPPAGTPASRRARMIREFAGSDIKIGWKTTSNGMRVA